MLRFIILSSCIAAALLASCSGPQVAEDPRSPQITPFPNPLPAGYESMSRLEQGLARSGAPPLVESSRWLEEHKWASTSLSLAGATIETEGSLILFFDIGERLPIRHNDTSQRPYGSKESILSWFKIPQWQWYETIVINEPEDPINNPPRSPRGQYPDNRVTLVEQSRINEQFELSRYAVEYNIRGISRGDEIHIIYELQGHFLNMAALRATQTGRDHLTHLAVIAKPWHNTVQVR